MSKFSAVSRFTPPLQFVRGWRVKTALAAAAAIAIAAIAIAAALLPLNDAPCDGLDINPHNYYPPADDARTVGLLLNEPKSICGYVLIPGRFNNYVHLIDHLGRIVNEWQFENKVYLAELLDNGNLLVIILEDDDSDGRNIAEVDPNGNIVWQYTHIDELHRDFIKMPNGNVLMLAQGVKTREEAIAAGANPDFIPEQGMLYDYLIEMRPAGSEGGEVVWEWSSWDYITQNVDAAKSNYGDPSDHPELIDANFYTGATPPGPRSLRDWLHTNAIDYNPELDLIALSPRQFSELWIIDYSPATEEAAARSSPNPRKDGALLYRYGNPRAYGHGTNADRQLFRQHHIQWIAPELPGAGDILIFNNGHASDEYPRQYSSIDQIVLPMDGYEYRHEPKAEYPPPKLVWTYTAETPADFYSGIMGGVQRLPNGNTLISESTSGTLFQITPDGKTVWKYVYPMDGDTPLKQGAEATLLTTLSNDRLLNNAVYRAYWYAPDHPGLQKYDLTPGDAIELYE